MCCYLACFSLIPECENCHEKMNWKQELSLKKKMYDEAQIIYSSTLIRQEYYKSTYESEIPIAMKLSVNTQQ
jgi:hypothetical protein